MRQSPTIIQLELGPMENFLYLLACPDTGRSAVIDAGWEPDVISARADAEGLVIEKILLTHTHHDHVGALPGLSRRLDAPVFVHTEEAGAIRGQCNDLVTIEEGQEIAVGNLTVQALHTPGHSPGGCTYLVGNAAFTGDVLFVGFCGRCDLAGGDCGLLWDSLHNKLLALPDDTVLYSGHNYGATPTSSVAHERKTNPYLQYPDGAAFSRRMLTGPDA